MMKCVDECGKCEQWAWRDGVNIKKIAMVTESRSVVMLQLGERERERERCEVEEGDRETADLRLMRMLATRPSESSLRFRSCFFLPFSLFPYFE